MEGERKELEMSLSKILLVSEVTEHIMSFLSLNIRDTFVLRRVCRHWKTTIERYTYQTSVELLTCGSRMNVRMLVSSPETNRVEGFVNASTECIPKTQQTSHSHVRRIPAEVGLPEDAPCSETLVFGFPQLSSQCAYLHRPSTQKLPASGRLIS